MSPRIRRTERPARTTAQLLVRDERVFVLAGRETIARLHRVLRHRTTAARVRGQLAERLGDLAAFLDLRIERRAALSAALALLAFALPGHAVDLHFRRS